MRRSVGGLDAGAGVVRRVVFTSNAGLQKLGNFHWLCGPILSEYKKVVIAGQAMVGRG